MSPAGGKLKRNAGSRSLFLAKSAPRLGLHTYPQRESEGLSGLVVDLASRDYRS